MACKDALLPRLISLFKLGRVELYLDEVLEGTVGLAIFEEGGRP